MRAVECNKKRCILVKIAAMSKFVQVRSGYGLGPLSFRYSIPIQKIGGDTKRKSTKPTKRVQSGRGIKKRQLGGAKKRKTRKKQTGGRKVKKIKKKCSVAKRSSSGKVGRKSCKKSKKN
jgi:hypothetical protein